MAKSKKSPSKKPSANRSRAYNEVSHSGYSRAWKRANYPRPLIIGVAAALILLIGLIGLFYWLNKTYTDPQRVFWAMIDNNLATPGVTREVKQSSGSESIIDISRLVFSPEPRVIDVQKRTQGSGLSANKLTLEGIGTPNNDYQHYSYIYQPGAKPGQNYDEVYKLWLLNSQTGGSPNSGTLFNNAVFGMVLFGNLPPSERTKLVDYIKGHNVYKIDYSKVKDSSNSRRTYTYMASMSLRQYAGAARLYAQMAGLKKAAQINPANYPPSAVLKLSLSVDALSRQLTQVVNQPSNLKIAYTSYGIAPEVKLPSKVVDAQTFQKVLTTVLE